MSQWCHQGGIIRTVGSWACPSQKTSGHFGLCFVKLDHVSKKNTQLTQSAGLREHLSRCWYLQGIWSGGWGCSVVAMEVYGETTLNLTLAEVLWSMSVTTHHFFGLTKLITVTSVNPPTLFEVIVVSTTTSPPPILMTVVSGFHLSRLICHIIPSHRQRLSQIWCVTKLVWGPRSLTSDSSTNLFI